MHVNFDSQSLLKLQNKGVFLFNRLFCAETHLDPKWDQTQTECSIQANNLPLC